MSDAAADAIAGNQRDLDMVIDYAREAFARAKTGEEGAEILYALEQYLTPEELTYVKSELTYQPSPLLSLINSTS
jgi:hypothetical protein